MPAIYFEKQFAAMCGQHLLNNLLQGRYFDPEGLSEIALTLDQQERSLGLSVDALRASSQNVDESGNFSIQVLEVALDTFGVKLARDEELTKALKSIDDASQPESKIEQMAFAFNYDNHWFCARYLHHQYWVLNSIEPEPKSVSRTMLTMFVTQMQAEGWSVFVTTGKLPSPTPRDEGPNWFVFGEEPTDKSSVKKSKPFEGKGYSLKGEEDDGDAELRQAMLASIADFDADNKVTLDDEPDASVKDAVLVQLILPPAGKKVRRRFQSSCKIEQIFAWANSLSEVSGRIKSIQKADDRSEIAKGDSVSSLGSSCALRVVVI